MAKRKCGKQLPRCSRCLSRGLECTYPPAKPTSFVLCPGEDTFSIDRDCISSTVGSPLVSKEQQWLDLHSPFDSQPLSVWFTAPETWKVVVPLERANLRDMEFAQFINTTRRWLHQWAETGSNPFVHHRLYRSRFPRCIQDAYMTLSCYLHKTSSNEKLIFKVIEDRASQLLEEYTTKLALDSLEHVARVQALLVYQFLGLYDGNIRMRHLAESRIPILSLWKQQMIQHASQVECLGREIISSTDQQPSEDSLWYSWVLAESIRRTWLVASGIQALYLIMQQNRHDLCHGGMMFTTRTGVWEAQSAIAWEKLCININVGLMQMAEAIDLFSELEPQEVNDFTKSILEINVGIEKVERWCATPR